MSTNLRQWVVLVSAILIAGCSAPNEDSSVTHAMPSQSSSDWGAVERAMGVTNTAPQASPIKTARPISELVAGLEARVSAEPENLGHRELLVQTYAFLGRINEAERAIADAVQLGADEAKLRAGLDQLRQQRGPQPW